MAEGVRVGVIGARVRGTWSLPNDKETIDAVQGWSERLDSAERMTAEGNLDGREASELCD